MTAIAKEDYVKYIKPFISGIYDVLQNNKLNQTESILVVDSFLHIINAEYNMQVLLKELKKITPLQKKVLENHCLIDSFNMAQTFLNSEQSE